MTDDNGGFDWWCLLSSYSFSNPSVYSLSMALTGFGVAVVRYTTISTISTGNTNNATTDPFFDTREVILVTGDGGIGTSVRQRPVCYIRSNDSIRVGVHRRNCVTTDDT